MPEYGGDLTNCAALHIMHIYNELADALKDNLR